MVDPAKLDSAAAKIDQESADYESLYKALYTEVDGMGAAGQIRSLNQNLATRLREIKKEMDNLASSWNSDASNTIRANFNALAPKFEEYRQVVDSYVKFLDNTVSAYDATESAINNNASAFK